MTTFIVFPHSTFVHALAITAPNLRHISLHRTPLWIVRLGDESQTFTTEHNKGENSAWVSEGDMRRWSPLSRGSFWGCITAGEMRDAGTINDADEAACVSGRGN